MSQPKPICRYYAQGHCRNGDACPFSHQGPGATQGGPSMQHCKYFLQGSCARGDSCYFLHDPVARANVAKRFNSVEEYMMPLGAQGQQLVTAMQVAAIMNQMGQTPMAMNDVAAGFMNFQNPEAAMQMAAGQMPGQGSFKHPLGNARPGDQEGFVKGPGTGLPPPFWPGAATQNGTGMGAQQMGGFVDTPSMPPGFPVKGGTDSSRTTPGKNSGPGGKAGAKPTSGKKSAFERLGTQGTNHPRSLQPHKHGDKGLDSSADGRRHDRGNKASGGSHEPIITSDIEAFIKQRNAKRKVSGTSTQPEKSARLDSSPGSHARGAKRSVDSDSKNEAQPDFAPKPLAAIKAEKRRAQQSSSATSPQDGTSAGSAAREPSVADIPLPKSRDTIRKEKAAAAAAAARQSTALSEKNATLPQGTVNEDASAPEGKASREANTQGQNSTAETPAAHVDVDDDDVNEHAEAATATDNVGGSGHDAADDLAQYEGMFD